MLLDVLEVSKKLMSFRSISGEKDQGSIEYLDNILTDLGFSCQQITFEGDGSYPVLNLYAEKGSGDRNLCFAGHTDVVPPGDEESWSVPPFEPQIVDGYLIGRGAVDMKASIAAWVVAVAEYLQSGEFKDKAGKLSFLITGDEEADSVNGTEKLLKWYENNGKKINSCVVGEPTNPTKVGEMMKVGRRGSINFELTVKGVQGHVAYPDQADNPVSKLVKILDKLDSHEFDKGNEFFPPTNLEVTSIDVGNKTTNLIPEQAVAKFNIRFNDIYDLSSVQKEVSRICSSVTIDYDLNAIKGSESFLSKPGRLADIISDSVNHVVNIIPEKTTTGGTSDARFIHSYVDEVVEFGLINETAHKVDEKISADELKALKNIYLNIITQYFS